MEPDYPDRLKWPSYDKCPWCGKGAPVASMLNDHVRVCDKNPENR